jgi:hypothetical protein
MDPFGLKVIFITFLVFVPLERLFALHPEQKAFRRDWANDVIFLLFNGLLTKLGLLAVVAVSIFAAAQIVPASFQAAIGGLPYWVQLPLVIVLSDLGFYWTHRMFHAVPWLWRFHAIHHSIEELDWLAAARVHPVDQILTKGVSLVPVFALGFSEWAIGVYALLYQWQSVLIHSNVRLDLARCASCLRRRSFIIGIIATSVRPGTRISLVSCPSSMRYSEASICRAGGLRQHTAWTGRCRNVTCLSCSIPSRATGYSSPNRTRRRWLRRCRPRRPNIPPQEVPVGSGRRELTTG